MPSDFLQSGVPDAYTTTRQRLTLFLIGIYEGRGPERLAFGRLPGEQPSYVICIISTVPIAVLPADSQYKKPPPLRQHAAGQTSTRNQSQRTNLKRCPICLSTKIECGRGLAPSHISVRRLVDDHGAGNPRCQQHPLRHFINMNSHRYALGQAHPVEGRVHIGDQFAALGVVAVVDAA